MKRKINNKLQHEVFQCFLFSDIFQLRLRGKKIQSITFTAMTIAS